MLKMVEENQLNRVATVNTLDRVKTLTAGTLYRSGQIVLNEDCLVHVKDRHNEKKREMITVLDKHKVAYEKRKEDINTILAKYNTKYKCDLVNWRAMNMSNVCATDQKILIGWLRRKGDAKIPSDGRGLTNRVVTDARLKAEPTLVQYLTNKGKSEADISTYLGLTAAQFADYTDDEGGRTEAAIGLLSFFEGGGGAVVAAVEGGNQTANDAVVLQEDV